MACNEVQFEFEGHTKLSGSTCIYYALMLSVNASPCFFCFFFFCLYVVYFLFSFIGFVYFGIDVAKKTCNYQM